MDAETLLRSYRERVEDRLQCLLPRIEEEPCRLHEAMRYSCLAPGKRLRPALCLAACKSVCGQVEPALDAASAIEMVHVFSLIHDDLPAIDDDDLRRGRPTCHKVYGEALAILAGDALFALGFESLARCGAETEHVLASVQALASATGSSGLVGGEVLDVESEGVAVNAMVLERIHMRKTGALIAASCEIGAWIGGASRQDAIQLREFGMLVGLAFQIIDDVLNETADEGDLGKAAGSDRVRGKATYPALYGLDASRQKAFELIDRANETMFDATIEPSELLCLSKYAVERIH